MSPLDFYQIRNTGWENVTHKFQLWGSCTFVIVVTWRMLRFFCIYGKVATTRVPITHQISEISVPPQSSCYILTRDGVIKFRSHNWAYQLSRFWYESEIWDWGVFSIPKLASKLKLLCLMWVQRAKLIPPWRCILRYLWWRQAAPVHKVLLHLPLRNPVYQSCTQISGPSAVWGPLWQHQAAPILYWLRGNYGPGHCH